MNEECDDGNNFDNDGCTALTCTTEFRYVCDSTTMPSNCTRTCGNGNFDPTKEECEDGNVDEYDGCDEDCMFESGWDCPFNTSTGLHVCT